MGHGGGNVARDAPHGGLSRREDDHRAAPLEHPEDVHHTPGIGGKLHLGDDAHTHIEPVELGVAELPHGGHKLGLSPLEGGKGQQKVHHALMGGHHQQGALLGQGFLPGDLQPEEHLRQQSAQPEDQKI